jgi:hypothetical protein
VGQIVHPEAVEDDRRSSGWSMGQVAWRLGVSVREYGELEAGTSYPSSETWHAMCDMYGWPQTFATS